MKQITRKCILLLFFCVSIFTLCSCGDKGALQQAAESNNTQSAPPSEPSPPAAPSNPKEDSSAGDSSSSESKFNGEDYQEHEQKIDISDDNVMEMPMGLPSTVKHSDKSKFTEAEWNEILKKIETGKIVWEE